MTTESDHETSDATAVDGQRLVSASKINSCAESVGDLSVALGILISHEGGRIFNTPRSEAYECFVESVVVLARAAGVSKDQATRPFDVLLSHATKVWDAIETTTGDQWSVDITVGGDRILTIESNSLSGKSDLNESDLEYIRTAGRHLLAFAGEPAT